MTNEVKAVLEQRGNRYGDFFDVAAIYSQIIDAVYAPGNEYTPSQKHALDAIAMKLARIANGDPNYIDNWVDIQGYARLEQEILERNDEQAKHQKVHPQGTFTIEW